jgi:TolB protein
MKKISMFFIAAVLLSSCLPGTVQLPQMPQNSLLPLLERKSGLIAYIGTDWNIYTSDQAGNHLTAYTKDALVPQNTSDLFHYYGYPTWSPDSESLGFVGISGKGNDVSADVYIAGVEDKAKKVFSSDTEHPVYLYWSPDNTNLGFLSSTADQSSMILQSVSSGQKDRMVIDTGSPYYWSWAPNGKTMVVHSGTAQSAVPEHLAFLQVASKVSEDGLDTSPASFQAPAWSPDGSHILMTRVDDKKNEIIVTNAQGKFEKAIGSYDLNTAFAWSAQGDRVAYLEGKQQIAAGVLGALHVIDINTSKELFREEDDDVLAFFWSPDGEKIAYFIPKINSDGSSSSDNSVQTSYDTQTQQQILLQLKVLDVKSGKSKELFTFQPTDQFFAILPYFDQYHQSATIWSPDSYNLVLPVIATNSTPSITIVPVNGQLEPRILTQGYLAFWSWK